MKNHITFGFLILFLSVLIPDKTTAQYYNQWPFAAADGIGGGFGASLLDFNGGQVNVIGPDTNYGYAIGHSSGFICDPSGQISLMTNGCGILDETFKPYPGFDSLVSSALSDNSCPERCAGFHRTLITSDLIETPTSIIIYHRSEYSENAEEILFSTHLFLTVASKKNDSLEVIVRQDTLRDSRAHYDGVAMIPHASKPAWWVLELSGFGTNGWLTYLVNKDTVEYFPEQFIGPEVTLRKFEGSQITFSPDGRKISILDQEEGVFIFDFDRSTGKLSNMRNYQADWMWKTDTTFLDGTCFSPNSEILYVSNIKEIYQIIEDRPDPIVKVVEIDFEPGAYSNFPVRVGEMQLGPDCRIYVSPRAVSGHMSVIHHPNRIGPDCGFEYKALLMPNMIFHQAPSTAFYHLGTGTSLCDSTIRWLSTSTRFERNKDVQFSLFPNPASEEIFIRDLEDQAHLFPLSVQITDVTGRTIRHTAISDLSESIPTHDLAPGLYLVTIVSELGSLGTKRVVIE